MLPVKIGRVTAAAGCPGRGSLSPRASPRLRRGLAPSETSTIVRVAASLGLNAYHGDAAAALVVDGQLVAAAEEERFNRVKHCAGFPSLSAAWCLADAGIGSGELDHVAVSRDPKANFGAKVQRTLLHGARPGYLKARLENAARVRDVRGELAGALGGEKGGLRALLHHVAHH